MRTKWLYAVLSACVLVANAPLAILLWAFEGAKGHNAECVWRVVAHNPNQYLFLALFLPVIAGCVGLGWHFLGRSAASPLPNPSLKNWRLFVRWLPFACTLGMILAATVSVFAADADEPDYSEFDVNTQCAGARAGLTILQSMTDAPPTTELVDEALELHKHWGVSREELVASIISEPRTSENLLRNTCAFSAAWLRYHPEACHKLSTLMPLDHKTMSVTAAIPTASILLYRNTATRLEQSGAVVRFDSLVNSNAWELGADLIIAWALLVGVAGSFVLRPVNEASEIWRTSHRRAVYALLAADSLFYVWIAFRAYAKSELQLLNGDRYEAIGDVAAVLILVTGVAIFLLSLLIDKKWLDYVGAGYPVICGIVTVAFSVADPVMAGRLFGSLAAWQTVALLAVSYLILVGLAILRALTA